VSTAGKKVEIAVSNFMLNHGTQPATCLRRRACHTKHRFAADVILPHVLPFCPDLTAADLAWLPFDPGLTCG
jgi:hypothetical protein